MGEVVRLRTSGASPLLPLPAEWLDAIARAIADALGKRGGSESARSPWMTRPEAAAYLGVPVGRLEKDRTVPAHRWDGRVFYNRDELDAFLVAFDRDGRR